MTVTVDFSKGLVPVILQHYVTKQVLMLGFMNEEAFNKTMEENVVTFYSRSKQRLWTKGESSGHTQQVVTIHTDCDNDAILIEVIPNGPTCHTGNQSCFSTKTHFAVQLLEHTIKERSRTNHSKSYTNYLLEQGIEKITKKFGEESFEVVIGAMKNDNKEVINEAADLIYHLFVLLHSLNISFSAIEKVLEQRHHKSNNFKGERDSIENW
ncbi:phosphoribosyl-AMP cyclohydrolase / phosphoribosyl-ATP pyrophosphohydrolase [Staphylococcus pasteuri]|uniref:Histidine biosynthesis bifunctional protein HisIE n=2 Tax=Staphylococcus TaxID=1279 RepID=A0ABY1GYG0_9STAP|nr:MULTISPECIES: bifunctional phosphoribosyl-AMP cyclohydrolase/phosphoribosyl-ATP diphosphatase HisIE [Staphylococcus]ATH62913.1 bifunctional phosphoribosyl-AMP cyclohydrolase/phosphoribosyl-ATP diphosphatase [Staphylococcus pasteuri]KKI57077.1 Phosphoribosyl-AMP cyclohydrolase [Staphylococcus pasteuri]MCF7598838.1 bifunctional phosphoribosyl-AMP cyclohydrolase/phosphoribosyl-ATP diphosphatase HisIE [Staphylococcus pasteuri]MDI3231209.1 bifunctional phosphoribosyl-AMP cyclohydrolase/phosphorib